MNLKNHDNSCISKNFENFFDNYNVTECNKQIKLLKFSHEPADRYRVR